VENQPVADKSAMGAEWLENWLPTQRGLKMRGGTVRTSFIASAVKKLFQFDDGTGDPRFFASSASQIFDISDTATAAVNRNATALVWRQGRWGRNTWGKLERPVASGFTSGDWAVQQVGTSGGDFLVAVNGADTAQIYDGTWNPLTDEAINDLAFVQMGAAFAVGETVTGGTSGATAEILGFTQKATLSGTLKLGAITGTFEDGEMLTSASGQAVASGTTSEASAITLTGVDTSTLRHVWLYQNRLFFVQSNSLRVWFLPAGAVGGAAQDISLAGVFRRGGKILFGTTWSLDSGDGLDDKCLFVTDQGEVAVYSGTNPAEAGNWSFEGRYDIGRPLGRDAAIQAGGDVLIATDDGIVPMNVAISKDPSRLSLDAISRPIKITWDDESRRAGGNVALVKWTQGDLMLSVFPEAERMLTANLETGAWAIQSGWAADCAGIYNGALFGGRSNGVVYKFDTGGTDDGAPFTAKLCYPFLDMGVPADYKVAQMMRGAFFADDAFGARYSVSVDYNVRFPIAPAAAPSSPVQMVWGTGVWGVNDWAGATVGDARLGVVDRWESVSGAGYAIAPMVQITSGGTTKLPVELVRLDILAEAGGRAS